jgi:16S rRNA (cytosine1402-N4)-methyltransferase
MNKLFAHETVLQDEAILALNIKPEGLYVDATFGRGGHSMAILEQLHGGRLLVIDKDPDAIHRAEILKNDGYPIEVRHGSFNQLQHWVEELGWLGRVNGILFDLGVSSPQLDDPERGFSFMKDGPLDMRMDPTQGMSAAEWLNTAKEEDIAHVLKTYGEERFAKRIAHKIVEFRGQSPLRTTKELAEVISEAQPIKDKHKHPATRSFQGIRIYINNELHDIEVATQQAIQSLAKGGRLVIISFHSLEDRAIKQALKKASQGQIIPYYIPIIGDQAGGEIKLLGKTKASEAEIKLNPRARSAMMRMAEKVV